MGKAHPLQPPAPVPLPSARLQAWSNSEEGRNYTPPRRDTSYGKREWDDLDTAGAVLIGGTMLGLFD